MAKRKKKNEKKVNIILLLVLIVVFGICYYYRDYTYPYILKAYNMVEFITGEKFESKALFVNVPNFNVSNLKDIPPYKDQDYIIINNNEPDFEIAKDGKKEFEKYSDLDILGRCGVAYANISPKVMPAEGETRGDISRVRPSGWIQKSYKGVVEGNQLYNRCHLIAYSLAGENDNEKNLITCTSNMNKKVMTIFETEVREYVRKTKNHVLYRVTPYYEGKNLVASGVQMEAYSVEDNGAGIKFNVYIYNVQKGIDINYLTGESKLGGK